MNLFDYTYVNGWMFFFLGLIPLLLLWYVLFSSKKNPSLITSSIKAFEGIKGGFVSYLRHLPFVLRLIALCFLITAIARPQKKLDDDTITEQSIEGIDIIISLDISQSMLAMDFRPNRLEASKEVAKEFIKKRPTDRIGLVVYEGESYTACALTTDHESLLKRFKNVKSGKIQGGTAIGMGLATGINRLRESEAKSKVIILLTDGENNSGKVHPLTAAEYAKEFGIRVYTIGVGTRGKAKIPVGTNPFTKQVMYDYIEGKIDEHMLTEIAKETGGKYYRAKNKNQLASIYEEIDKLEKAKINTIMYKKDLPEAFHWFAMMGLFFLGLEFLFRYVLVRRTI